MMHTHTWYIHSSLWFFLFTNSVYRNGINAKHEWMFLMEWTSEQKREREKKTTCTSHMQSIQSCKVNCLLVIRYFSIFFCSWSLQLFTFYLCETLKHTWNVCHSLFEQSKWQKEWTWNRTFSIILILNSIAIWNSIVIIFYWPIIFVHSSI